MQLKAENQYLKEDVLSSSSEILGESPAILSVLEKIDRVAPTDAPVLILDEKADVREDQIHARMLRPREHDAGVDDENPVAEPNGRHVHTELTDASQRDDLERRTDARWPEL